MDGYIPFRGDRSENHSGGVALCVREQLECIKLYSGTDEQVESLWLRIKEQANMGDTVLGVYYRPPDEEEEVDEVFCRQLEIASQLQALILLGTDTVKRSNRAWHTQFKKFLNCSSVKIALMQWWRSH